MCINFLKFLKIIKKIMVIIKDTILHQRLARLERGKFYGIRRKIKFVDQLGNPNLKLVSGYYGKINDIDAAVRFGTKNIKEFSFWAWRSCGPAVATMILKTETRYMGNLFAVVKEMLEIDGYLFEDRYGNKDIGWKHSAIKKVLEKRGLFAKIKPDLSTNELLLNLVNKYYVIASLKSRLNPKTSHLILVSGFRWDDKATKLTIHDPYTLDGKGGTKEIDLTTFKNEFLHRGIIAKKIDFTDRQFKKRKCEKC